MGGTLHLLEALVDHLLPWLNVDHAFMTPRLGPDVLFRPFPGISQVRSAG